MNAVTAFKTGIERVDVLSTPVIEERTAGVKVSGKMFNLLTRIYSRPVEAGIREIVNNGIDANYEAGRPDAPVIINVPKTWDTMVSIRDHGRSMSHDFMMTRYMRLGDSTKELDATQTGFWGIGSKAPLAAVDQYWVTCFQNGEKRVYSITRKTFDEADGSYDTIPVIALVTTTPTDEPDGTEVSWAVEQNQVSEILKAVALTMAGCAGKANVVVHRDGALTTDYNFVAPAVLSGKDWALYQSQEMNRAFGRTNSMIRVGRILYNLNLSAIQGHIKDATRRDLINRLFNQSAILEIDMTKVRVSPSREELEYTPSTIQAIIERADQILDELTADCQAEVDAATCLWDATAALMKHCADGRLTSFLVNKVRWNGRKLEAHGIDIPSKLASDNTGHSFRTVLAGNVDSRWSYKPTSYTQYSRSYNNHRLDPTKPIVTFVTTLGDKACFGLGARIAEYLKANNADAYTQVLVLRQDPNETTTIQTYIDQFGFGPDQPVVDVASLPMPAKVPSAPKPKRVKQKGEQRVRLYSPVRRVHNYVLRSEIHDVSTMTAYYVELPAEGELSMTAPSGEVYYSGEYFQRLVSATEPERKGVPVYFVRKDMVDKFLVNNPHWASLWDLVIETLNKAQKSQDDINLERDYRLVQDDEIAVWVRKHRNRLMHIPTFATFLAIADAVPVPKAAVDKDEVANRLSRYVRPSNLTLTPKETAVTNALNAVKARYSHLETYVNLRSHWSVSDAQIQTITFNFIYLVEKS